MNEVIKREEIFNTLMEQKVAINDFIQINSLIYTVKIERNKFENISQNIKLEKLKNTNNIQELIEYCSKNNQSGEFVYDFECEFNELRNRLMNLKQKGEKILHCINEKKEDIVEIGENTIKLKNIIEMINILAINGSIEAVHPEKCQNIFNFLSKEIFSLSIESAKVVKKIETLIERSKNELYKENENIVKISEEIQTISKKVQCIQDSAKNTTINLNQYEVEKEEINKQMMFISDIAHNNSEKLKEVSLQNKKLLKLFSQYDNENI